MGPKSKREYLYDGVKVARAAARLLAYAFRHFPFYTAGLLAAVFAISVFPFVSNWLNSRVIDQLVGLVTGDIEEKYLLFRYIALLFAIFLIRGAIDNVRAFFELDLYFGITREFTNDVTKKMAFLDTEYYEDPKINDLLQKVAEHYSSAPQEFVVTSFWIISSIIRIISGIGLLVTFSPLVVVFLLFTTIPELVNNVVFGRRKWGIWHARGEVKRDYWRTRWNLISEFPLMELRVFRAREYLLERMYNLFYKFQKEQINTERKRGLTNFFLDLLSAAGFGIVFLMMVLAVVSKSLSIGQFNFYVSTARRLQESFGRFFSRISRLYEQGLYVVDIFTVLDLSPKIVSGQVILPAAKNPPLIEFRDVCFKYPGTNKEVITRFNLIIRPGEHIAIVGENGAGKTTLIKLLMRFYDVTSGEIVIDGYNIKEVDLESWYAKVGTLFQEFNTYHFDAKTNIGIGDVRRLSDFRSIVEAAKKAGAHDFIEKYENKYNQVLDKAFKSGIRPSWGQWQRIALARAFFKDAPVLILDEPTSALDPKAEYEVFQQLFGFAQGKTVIIISHRFSTVRNAQRIVVLREGRIKEQGSHEELMQIENGMYKTFFDLQKKGYE